MHDAAHRSGRSDVVFLSEGIASYTNNLDMHLVFGVTKFAVETETGGW